MGRAGHRRGGRRIIALPTARAALSIGGVA
jgi:hypothetical protein